MHSTSLRRRLRCGWVFSDGVAGIGANSQVLNTGEQFVVANGREVAWSAGTIEEFLQGQRLLPRSVVVEHNGEAVAPSEFSSRQLKPGDRLEIVKIVAGG